MIKLVWKLDNKIEKAGLLVVKLLTKSGCQAFFVGGIVRDHLLKRESDNLDIATDCLPNQVEKILDEARIKHKSVGKKFGTILAIVDGELVEITTFRRESRYSDQRHPDQVEFIREYLDDARRRDLTINALYYEPSHQQIFDPVNGSKDLNAKLIRFVGDPKKRIDEDPLRMLRAVRFATTFGFKIEKNSFAAIKTRAKLIQSVSGERVKSEFDKILISENRVSGMRLLSELGLLRFILPDLELLKKIFHRSKKYHLEGNVFEHTLNVIDVLPANLDLLYAGLFHDLGKTTTGHKELKDGEWVYRFTGHETVSLGIFNSFATRYPFPKSNRDLIAWLIQHHDDRTNYLDMKPENRIKYSMHKNFQFLVEIWAADSFGNLRLDDDGKIAPGMSEKVIAARKLLKEIETKKKILTDLSSGKFIIRETKLLPGVQIGNISEKIKIKIISGEIKNETDAKNFLKKITKKS